MINRVISADFSARCGKIKPICALNGGPLLGGAMLPYDFSEEYKDMNIPLVRVAGRAGEYGFGQRIDKILAVPNSKNRSFTYEIQNAENRNPSDN